MLTKIIFLYHLRTVNQKNIQSGYRNPKVLDGSIVTVGKLPEEEPFNLTEYLKEVTAIAASVAQTLSILLIASRS